MKILFVHNRYQQAGGEDNVVTAEAKLLADQGHDVELWSVDNKDRNFELLYMLQRLRFLSTVEMTT